MVETEAEEKDAAERERLRDDLWSSMSSSERLRGLPWSGLWFALDFLQQVRWARGSMAAVDILLFCQGRSWRNVGKFRLEFWVKQLLTATGTRDVWSFLGLRFTLVAVMACARVRHGSDRYAPNAEYAPTLLQTLLACCICGCSVV